MASFDDNIDYKSLYISAQKELALFKKEKELSDKLYEMKIAELKLKLKKVLRKLFHSSSDSAKDEVQKILSEFPELLNEYLEDETSLLVKEVDQAEEVKKTRKKRSVNGSDTLNKVTSSKTISVDLVDKVCPDCGSNMNLLDTQEKKIIMLQKRIADLVQLHKKRYICPKCGLTLTASHDEELPNSPVSLEMMKEIIINKHLLGIPIYRQVKMYEQFDFPVSEALISKAELRGTDALVDVGKLITQKIAEHTVIGFDETPIRIINMVSNDNRQGYFWIMCSAKRSDIKAVSFIFSPSRSADTFMDLSKYIKDGTFIQCDGYSVYHKNDKLIVANCHAHCRRYFTDILSSAPKGYEKSLPAQMVALYKKLYAVEKECKDFLDTERFHYRIKNSISILDEMIKLAKDNQNKYQGTAIGTAINYLLNNWEGLTTFLKNGRIEIDSNFVESNIRPLVIVRKNMLFCSTEEGARRVAAIHTVLSTAQLNHIKIPEYLKYLLKEIIVNNHQVSEEMLPWSTTIQKKFGKGSKKA